jgi:hypothetical protein
MSEQRSAMAAERTTKQELTSKTLRVVRNTLHTYIDIYGNDGNRAELRITNPTTRAPLFMMSLTMGDLAHLLGLVE